MGEHLTKVQEAFIKNSSNLKLLFRQEPNQVPGTRSKNLLRDYLVKVERELLPQLLESPYLLELLLKVVWLTVQP